MNTCHSLYICPNPQNVYSTPRVNSKPNYELWVIMMHQCRFINCNKLTTLVGILIVREAMHVCMCGARGICKISIYVFQLCCEPKTTLKNSLLIYKVYDYNKNHTKILFFIKIPKPVNNLLEKKACLYTDNRSMKQNNLYGKECGNT